MKNITRSILVLSTYQTNLPVGISGEESSGLFSSESPFDSRKIRQWHFVRPLTSPVAFRPGGIFRYGILSGGILSVTFFPVAFCPVALCPGFAVEDAHMLSEDLVTIRLLFRISYALPLYPAGRLPSPDPLLPPSKFLATPLHTLPFF